MVELKECESNQTNAKDGLRNGCCVFESVLKVFELIRSCVVVYGNLEPYSNLDEPLLASS